MTTEQNKKTEDQTANQKNAPDYVAVQYRTIKTSDGWITRSERIGVAWDKDERGGFTFRPSGRQIIEDDIHFIVNSEE